MLKSELYLELLDNTGWFGVFLSLPSQTSSMLKSTKFQIQQKHYSFISLPEEK